MSKRVQLSVKERNAAIRSKISEMLEAERFGGKVKAEVVGVTNNFFRFAAKLGYLERREDNQYRVLVKFTDEVINHVYTEVRSYYSDWKEKWGENFKNKKIGKNNQQPHLFPTFEEAQDLYDIISIKKADVTKPTEQTIESPTVYVKGFSDYLMDISNSLRQAAILWGSKE